MRKIVLRQPNVKIDNGGPSFRAASAANVRSPGNNWFMERSRDGHAQSPVPSRPLTIHNFKILIRVGFRERRFPPLAKKTTLICEMRTSVMNMVFFFGFIFKMSLRVYNYQYYF